eukprot:Gregarina_sp_Poly_1__4463@NODE_23_length_20322_cov_242_373192_g21_i0_p4_GENE_NODE_23_length_20322_cov_242_373192_g21_i0NODE_23_length_20322_cov_242_373192_g21_i0_p4_ORF_typecomplete_len684_score81_44Mod_r/PF07200_13/10Mod_r/PF07200_13/0_0059APG17/PF04108_12/0_021MT/PF12777_7/0_024PhoU/PF01895_19/0_84PhoU/PF01895_19/9_2e02Cep57_CLD_2/PF14197_6/0_72Cep57_CLD_2/PF14197_6/1_4e03_NODE_23_length_20322_cov_242_373192_g21_i0805910110
MSTMSVSSNEVAPDYAAECTALRNDNATLIRHLRHHEKRIDLLQTDLQRALQSSAAKDTYIKTLGDKFADVRENYQCALMRVRNRDDLVLYLRQELRRFYSAIAGLTTESEELTNASEELTRHYDQGILDVSRILVQKWNPSELSGRLNQIIQENLQTSRELKQLSRGDMNAHTVIAHVASIILHEVNLQRGSNGESSLATSSPPPSDPPSLTAAPPGRFELPRLAASPLLDPSTNVKRDSKLLSPRESTGDALNLSVRAAPRRNRPLQNWRQPKTHSVDLAPSTTPPPTELLELTKSAGDIMPQQPGRRSRTSAGLMQPNRTGIPRERRAGHPPSRTRQKRDASQIPDARTLFKLSTCPLLPDELRFAVPPRSPLQRGEMPAESPPVERPTSKPQRRKIDPTLTPAAFRTNARKTSRAQSTRTDLLAGVTIQRKSFPSRKPVDWMTATVSPLDLTGRDRSNPRPECSDTCDAISPKSTRRSPGPESTPGRKRQASTDARPTDDRRRSGRLMAGQAAKSPPIYCVDSQSEVDNSAASNRSSMPTVSSPNADYLKQRMKGRSLSPVGGRKNAAVFVPVRPSLRPEQAHRLPRHAEGLTTASKVGSQAWPWSQPVNRQDNTRYAMHSLFGLKLPMGQPLSQEVPWSPAMMHANAKPVMGTSLSRTAGDTVMLRPSIDATNDMHLI